MADHFEFSGTHAWVIWVVRTVIGVTLLLSGGMKLRDLTGFALGVRGYHLLPQTLVRPLATLLPFAEITLGILLLANVAAPWPAIGSLILFGVFAAAVVINLLRGRDIPCFCMGTSSRETIGLATLLRLGLLATASVVIIERGSVSGGLLPLATTEDDAFRLVSIVIHACLLLALFGPFEFLAAEVARTFKASQLRAKHARGAKGQRVAERGSDRNES